MADSYPANSVSLRSVAEGNFTVIDTTDGGQKVVAEVDYSSAPLTLYEGAIYMVQAEPWQVERLDWVGRKAFVRRTRADYYTDAIDYTRLKVLERFEATAGAAASCARGEVHLVRRVAGYKKIRYYTHENVGYGNIQLPDQEMHTTALWWELGQEALDAHFATRWQALDGFLGAAYALHTVAALLSMCEPHDLGRAVGDGEGTSFANVDGRGRGQLWLADGEPGDAASDPRRFHPTVFLYDNYPGGIGLSAGLFDQRQVVVARAAALVRGCECRSGCPACVGPILASEESRGLAPKQAALTVLELLGSESSGSGRGPA
jgi:DEAD/DEAH box helicase domain-containing protein